jgi:Family of unknown function (DUF6364)
MAKLTLSVDGSVVKTAKRYARRHGTSVSHLVEQYLGLVALPPGSGKDGEDPPVLKMFRGAARGVDADAYRRHLIKKHR